MDAEYQGTGLSPKDIGISTPPMKDQLEGLKARIFQGASRVELGFTGTGKGSMGRGAPTPGTYGKEEREAIRELAKINKVDLTTHATVGVGGLAGFTERGLDEATRERNLKEIERAIDFAADTARGGPVVVHTGEWPRPIAEKYSEFKEYPSEKERAVLHIVDKRTGEVMAIRKDMTIHEPVYRIDEKTGEKIYEYEYNPDGSIKGLKFRERKYDDIVKEELKKNPELDPEEAFIKHYYESEEAMARAESVRWATEAHERRKLIEEIEKIPEKDRWKFADLIAKAEDAKRDLKWMEEAAVGYGERAELFRGKAENFKPIEKVGLEKSADSIARAAEYAMELTELRHLPKPLFVAPENVFPEQYGAHPQELKKLIVEAREKMAKDLQDRYGKSEEEAKRLAEQHIKATFDVGHAYTWRKYFERKPGETIEEADKRFNKWLAKQVEELTKEGIIGHVHVSDNFGWADEHVTPGKGRVPIKDFIEQIKKAGIKNVIVEPAHQDFKAMLGGWSEFGSSIYSVTIPGVRRDTWTDVEHSYFGRTAPPYYVVGPFAPSKDWTLWSQTPLE